MLEVVPRPAAWVDGSGVVRAANEAWRAMVGFEEGRRPSHECLSAEVTLLLADVLVGRAARGAADTPADGPGGRLWLRWHVAATPDGALVLAEDVTAEHAAAERLDAVLHHLPAAVFVLRHRDGRLVEASAEVETLCGVSRAEVVGKSAEHVAALRNKGVRRLLADAAEQPGVAIADRGVELRLPGGRRQALAAARVADYAGEPCTVLTLVDVSDRWRSQVQLRTRTQRYRLAFEAHPCPARITRADGEPFAANHAAAALGDAGVVTDSLPLDDGSGGPTGFVLHLLAPGDAP
jgi:PAS domain S-box-containing protein